MVTSDTLQERLFNNRVWLVAVTLRDLKWDRAHRHLPDEHIIASSTKHQPLYPHLYSLKQQSNPYNHIMNNRLDLGLLVIK
jgi:hypothetical protein